MTAVSGVDRHHEGRRVARPGARRGDRRGRRFGIAAGCRRGGGVVGGGHRDRGKRSASRHVENDAGGLAAFRGQTEMPVRNQGVQLERGLDPRRHASGIQGPDVRADEAPEVRDRFDRLGLALARRRDHDLRPLVEVRAGRIEVRETPDGYHSAVAIGAAGKPATFRQKRDGVDEWIEGEAERLEYDGKTDTIRFVTNAAVRRLRGSTVADEIAGNLVSYDSIAEVFSVSGGAAATPTNPGGRVRAVLTPREGSAAAAEAAAAAASQSAPPLKLLLPMRMLMLNLL